MNLHLQNILTIIQQDGNITDEQKDAILKSLKDANKEFDITAFKLDRTEKVKRTTAILLEETIEELEQKRKAVEAQNRELEIEASLERVRTIAMGMSMPEDLLNISKANFNELTKLGFSEIRNSLIGIFHDDRNYFTDYDYSDFSGGSITNIPYNKNSIIDKSVQQMKSATDAFTEFIVEGKELEEWKTFRKQNGEYEDTRLTGTNELYYYFYSIEQGNVGISTFKKISDEHLNILKRFRNVFDLAYKRYTDITTAGEQAREAQIETGLERVRSRSMAMHNTSELQQVIHTVHKELLNLNIAVNGGSFIAINSDIETTLRCWGSGGTADTSEEVQLPLYDKPFCTTLINGIKSRRGFFTEAYTQQEKKDFFTFLFEYEPWSKLDAAQKSEILLSPGGYVRSCYVSQHTTIFIINHFGENFSAADNDILKRFGNVFEQTYTRFLDLQKAEAQSKEAHIQLALERARAQSMTMQHSSELDDTLRVFHEQVLQLNIPSAFSFLWLPDEEKDNHIFWAAWAENNLVKSKSVSYPLDRTDPATAQCLIDWKSEEHVVSYDVPPEGVESYFAAWSELIAGVDELDPANFSEGLQYVEAFIKYGCFGVMVKHILPEDQKQILGRFAIEFERAYTRFLDLQKAEAQAREAEIELALERIRARTMAMQHSDELAEASFLLDSQVRMLGIKTRGCAFNIYGDKESTEWFSSEMGTIPTYKTPRENIFLHYYQEGRKGKQIHIETFSGESCAAHYDYLCSLPVLGESLKELKASGGSFPVQQTDHVTYFKYGYLLFITLEPVPDAHDIFIRFAKVFEQTYTRFLDLQKAEAQAREAQIETALERVRSRTLAMQKSDELAETAAVLFQQLIALGIEPNRLYIAIMKDEIGASEFWITDEDGTKISTAFAANLNDNESFAKMFEGWKQQKKSMVINMQGDELQSYFNHLASLGVPFKSGLTQKRRVQDIAYFGKGFIGIASPDDQPAETLLLLERFAAVFNLTFTRFNDLKIAEAHAEQAEQDLIAIKEAKQHAEAALTELQATQKQLVQSEKMASLGELTAGIAHEIQNPLNFVNNFSEVSKELLDEMKEAIDKGDTDEAKEIMHDVIQNLEKIHHHGKRADSIVKGMLQHSRSSSNQKEPTNINALADEYLRLAYHGFRAKDKSFNATLKTNFDETIGSINIVPQDIGRVVLNLINNAFYAVNEKKKQHNEEYEPTVSVTTTKKNQQVEIIVSDNGNGIPKNVVDKIFQPFFTTKPTGQGTGLGLSLAYDILKAHGGELKVDTNESEGSEFIISLPG